MNCVSCHNVHDEKYYPNCGEKSGIQRITLRSMIEDTFSSITNMDRGFLYNLKTLTLNPKKITTYYIRGKRKGILNPISYLIFAITLYLIVITVFDAPKETHDVRTEAKYWLKQLSFEIGQFIRAYIKYIWILSIIPLGISLKLVYKKYNYLEYLAIS